MEFDSDKWSLNLQNTRKSIPKKSILSSCLFVDLVASHRMLLKKILENLLNGKKLMSSSIGISTGTQAAQILKKSHVPAYLRKEKKISAYVLESEIINGN